MATATSCRIVRGRMPVWGFSPRPRCLPCRHCALQSLRMRVLLPRPSRCQALVLPAPPGGVPRKVWRASDFQLLDRFMCAQLARSCQWKVPPWVWRPPFWSTYSPRWPNAPRKCKMRPWLGCPGAAAKEDPNFYEICPNLAHGTAGLLPHSLGMFWPKL